MPDAGVFSLANLAAGILGATMTGPLGGVDVPQTELTARMLQQPSGFAATLSYRDGSPAGHSRSGNVPVQVSDLPESFIRAVMAVEDKRFGTHGGIDPVATASALVSALRGDVRGGSTISQQAVKNVVTGSEFSIDRKIAEGVLAVRAHVDLTPDEVLSAYLNAAWFGRGVTGAGYAAQIWFGRDWDELSLGEVAFLAGLLKGASHYDPVRHPERAKERRDHVIGRMEAEGWITAAEADAARAEELEVVAAPEAEGGDLWAVRATKAEMRELALDPAVRAQTDLALHLTLDPRWQEIAEGALREGVTTLVPQGSAGRLSPALLRKLASGDREPATLRAAQSEAARFLSRGQGLRRITLVDRSGSGEWIALSDSGYGLPGVVTIPAGEMPQGYQPRAGHILPGRMTDGELQLEAAPGIQGAVVVLDPRTGELLASIGGHDPVLSEFDRTRAHRQPGSAIKPFLWLAALNLGYAYDSPVTDVQRTFINESGEAWTPQNYDRSATGMMPLYRALERSSNLAAANIADTIGIEAMAAMAERFGAYPDGGMKRVLSASLGSSEVRLRELVAGYAGLINDGIPVSPHVVARAEAPASVLWERSLPQDRFSATDEFARRQVVAMLRGVVVRGTAYNAFREHPVPLVGKTGTSQEHRDVWFIGMTPDVAVGVWLGRDDNQPLPGRLTGGTSAALVTASILRQAHANGLVDGMGMRGRSVPGDWPPALLSEGEGYWMAGDGFLHNYDPRARSMEPARNDFDQQPRQSNEIVIRSLW